MNKGGLQNKMGEIINELDQLIDDIAPMRKTQSTAKLSFEQATGTMDDLQAFLTHNFQIDPEVKWENPSPILDAKGNPMPEYEAHYRSMLINFHIQNNESFKLQLDRQNKTKETYYEAETNVVTTMERIGVLRAELNGLAGLARLIAE